MHDGNNVILSLYAYV